MSNRTDSRFAYWFRWSAVNVGLPAMSLCMLVTGVAATGVFASGIHAEPSRSLAMHWVLILSAVIAFFVGILGAQSWHIERERFRARTRDPSP